MDVKKLMGRLWGDNFYSKKESKWNKTGGGDDYVRGFCQFILDPIYKVRIVPSNDNTIKGCFLSRFLMQL